MNVLVFVLNLLLGHTKFNFLFYEPTELRFLKIEKKKSIRKLKIKKVLSIFPFKHYFLYLCIFQETCNGILSCPGVVIDSDLLYEPVGLRNDSGYPGK